MGGGFGPFTGAGAISIITGLPFSSPSTPQGSAMIGAGYARLPGGDFIPKKLIDNFDRCDPAAFDAAVLQNMQYRQYRVLVPAGASAGKIDSDQIPSGFFWYVLGMSLRRESSGSGSMNANLLMLPPSLVTDPGPGGAGLLTVGPGVVIDNQNAVSGGTVQAMPNEIAIARKFSVPPGWFLRAAVSSSAALANAQALVLDIAFAQLKLDLANLRG